MGVWGMGVSSSDEFCENYEKFFEAYDAGEEVRAISARILAEYHAEFDDNDGVMHDVYFALAKAEWMCCDQSPEILARVREIIDSGTNIEFYRELGADERDLKTRQKALERFWQSLQTPREKPRKRVPPPKPVEMAKLEKGDVFFFKCKSGTFGAILLEEPVEESGNPLIPSVCFIAISEKLPKMPKRIENVLDAPAMTAVWTGHTLPASRAKILGRAECAGSYQGRGGQMCADGLFYVENGCVDILESCTKLAADTNRVREIPRYFTIENPAMRDLLDPATISAEIQNPELLHSVYGRIPIGVQMMSYNL